MKLLMSVGLAILGLVALGAQAFASTSATLVTGTNGAFALTRPGCGWNPCTFAYLPPGTAVQVFGSVVGSDGRTYDAVYANDWRGVPQTGYVLVSAFPGAAPLAPPKLIYSFGA